MLPKISLQFHGTNPQLSRTEFDSSDQAKHIAVRGKTAGAQFGAGTFQWTSAVRALSLILVRSNLAVLTGEALCSANLSGYRGSLASSLDYAITKEPNWTSDIFGVDTRGHSLIRRLFIRTNTEQRLPGPVIVGLNQMFLHPARVDIWWNSIPTAKTDSLHLLIQALENDVAANGDRVQHDFCLSTASHNRQATSEREAVESN